MYEWIECENESNRTAKERVPASFSGAWLANAQYLRISKQYQYEVDQMLTVFSTTVYSTHTHMPKEGEEVDRRSMKQSYTRIIYTIIQTHKQKHKNNH